MAASPVPRSATLHLSLCDTEESQQHVPKQGHAAPTSASSPLGLSRKRSPITRQMCKRHHVTSIWVIHATGSQGEDKPHLTFFCGVNSGTPVHLTDSRVK